MQAEWREHVDAFLRAPFDLFEAPPLRAMLLIAAPSRLVVVVHHVAADMDAMAIMRTEFAAHCTALAHHQLSPLLAPLERTQLSRKLLVVRRGRASRKAPLLAHVLVALAM